MRLERISGMMVLCMAVVYLWVHTACAGDVIVQLDSTNGTSSLVVYDQQTNVLFRVKSDGNSSFTGMVSAAMFSGSGAFLRNIGSSAIASNAITTLHIAAGAVKANDIGTGAITSNHLASGTVTADALEHAYESGAISLVTFLLTNVTTFVGWNVTTNVALTATYGTRPVVTLSLETPSRTVAQTVSPFVSSRTLTNFTVEMSIPDAQPQTVASDGQVGQYAFAAMINGRPAIAYEDVGNKDLTFAIGSNINGTSWRTPVMANGTPTPIYISLAEVIGRPAIAFHNSSNSVKNLYYVLASNALGTAWGAPVLVDGSGANDIGHFTSLAVIDGNPAIGYYDETNDDLKYARADNAVGSSWSTVVTVYSSGSVGKHVSLKTVDTLPAMAFYDVSNTDLLYIRALNTSGSAWPVSPVEVYTNDNTVGKFASMEIVNGNPAIAFHDDTDNDLLFVRATDSTGSAWDTPIEVYTNADVGAYCSMAIVNSRPAIAFYDKTEDQLMYVRADDASGTSWGDPEILHTNILMSVRNTTLLDVNDAPAVGYYDSRDNDVYYMRAGNPPEDTVLNWIAVEP